MYTHARRVWWQCSLNPLHEWKARVHVRVGYSMPELFAVSSLPASRPHSLYHYNNNSRNRMSNSTTRASNNSDSGEDPPLSPCPFCTGRKLHSPSNSISAVYPQLARQWHPSLNGSNTPDNTAYGQNKYVRVIYYVCIHVNMHMHIRTHELACAIICMCQGTS